ncbi:MAG: ligase-associated DNA damage response DEXH box helicase [Alphaproteobacteria bacterium]|nr:ligase-associated DNA damage response DEXH box helicase [Alphaproteobacteria bacterium]
MDKRAPATLPEAFEAWFAGRGWSVRPHQRALFERVRSGASALLIAPTGGGKTLAGFLPSLVDLSARPPAVNRPHALHTLYISPLKALTADVARNLETPVREMGLSLRIETRTGDTPPSKRQRQRAFPPDILLTTPEQLCLLIASEHPRAFFQDVRIIIIDEIHALAPTKRGDLLALALARIARWSEEHVRIGLSATVAEPLALARWLAPDAVIVRGAAGAAPVVDVLDTDARIPWSGHTGRHVMGDVYAAIKRARLALVFVNTRAQAEMTFQELWRVNDDNLAIALHHGSLDVAQRKKVENAMARGDLRAVVCTSTLDLGIDWGDVDLVVQMGAPKGASRLVQRIGRANHRLDEPSRALLAPTNRFEVLECRAARDAVSEGALDGAGSRLGGLDCMAQHIMGAACGEPFSADALYEEAVSTAPYADLSRAQFDQTLNMVATGGYALSTYDRYRRIIEDPKTKLWRARTKDAARQHRMNVGAIIEAEMLDVRLAPGRAKGGAETPAYAGRRLGQIEEWFIEGLTPGDTFLFAGEILRFIGLRETDVLTVRAKGETEPRIPSYAGGKFPLSTFLAARVRAMLHDRDAWKRLPDQVQEWLTIQALRSVIPEPDHLLIETFPRANKHYMVCYPFDGRLAHQTLGMLLTRRLERLRKQPLGFVASEYALSVWGFEPMGDVDFAALFDEDMLGDDLDAWLAESALMKRTFRNCAIIAGMIERRYPGQEKTGRQVTFSADLIYDVLRAHEPDHVLLKAAFADASEGFLDISRVGALLKRARGKLTHIDLPRVSPFAVPVMLEIGRETAPGVGAVEAVLSDVAGDLIADAMGDLMGQPVRPKQQGGEDEARLDHRGGDGAVGARLGVRTGQRRNPGGERSGARKSPRRRRG